MPKQPFYKIGSFFNQNGDPNSGYTYDRPKLNYIDPKKQDPNKGEGPDYKTYTDPKTNTKGKLDSGRSYAQAYKIAQDKGLTVPGESQKQYSDFAKKQLANYRETGVWMSRKDLGFQDRYDTDGRNTTSSSGGNASNKAIDSSSKVNIDASKYMKDYSKLIGPDPMKVKTNLTGGKEKGLVRRAKQGKFEGKLVDKTLGRLGTGKAGKQFIRSLKKESAAEGMTGRERRLQKQLAKATANMAAAGGSVTKSRDGKEINRSNTGNIGINADAAFKGRARRKAFRAVKRANRIYSRMKDYEGDNYSRAFEK